MSSSWPLVPSALPALNASRTPLFLGKGLKCPLREDPLTGGFQTVEGEDNVKQCLRDGVLTALGERVMAEGLGTVARRLLFEESEVVSDLLAPSIRDYVDRYEPRVILSSVSVVQTSLSEEGASYTCSIVYVTRATNKRGNLVFPFYLRAQSGAEGV